MKKVFTNKWNAKQHVYNEIGLCVCNIDTIHCKDNASKWKNLCDDFMGEDDLHFDLL